MKYHLTICDVSDNPVVEINTLSYERLEEEYGAFTRSPLCKQVIKEEMQLMAEAIEADRDIRRELEVSQLAGII